MPYATGCSGHNDAARRANVMPPPIGWTSKATPERRAVACPLPDHAPPSEAARRAVGEMLAELRRFSPTDGPLNRVRVGKRVFFLVADLPCARGCFRGTLWEDMGDGLSRREGEWHASACGSLVALPRVLRNAREAARRAGK